MVSRTVIFVVALFFHAPALGEIYWVSPTGEATWQNAKSATPLSREAACSLTVANRNIGPGDTVYLRGGKYTGVSIRPERSGNSSDKPILFSGYDDEEVVFSESAGIYLLGKSFVSVTGMKFRSMMSFFRIYGGHNNIISHCLFDGRSRESSEWAGALIVKGPPNRDGISENSTHNWVHHCEFYRWVYKGPLPNRGALLDIGNPVNRNPRKPDQSSHNRVEHCVFAYGGHHTLGVFSQYNVIRFNYIHNETNPRNWDFPGYRGAITQGLAGGRSLWEGNRFGFSDHKGLDIRTPHNILRHNYFFHNGYGGIQIATNLTGIDRADENYIYQNTFYRNGHAATNSGFQGGIYFANWMRTPPAGVSPKNNVVKNNLFHENKQGSVIAREGKILPQRLENNSDNDADPKFLNTGNLNPDIAGLPDLRISEDSPVRDKGTWLTVTTSRTTQSDTFSVEDANYFTDGWGIIEGDRIQVEGEVDSARIKKVNYSTGEIQIDRSISIEKGRGVSLAFSGRAPELGAYEIQPASNIEAE